MDTLVFAVVLVGAACHAGWNTVVKSRLDPLAVLVLVTGMAGAVAVPLLAVTGVPRVESLPYLALSVSLHIGYSIFLGEAYRHGDLGQVYPLARGSAPLLTALASVTLIGEAIAPLEWLGIVLLVAGVLLLSLRGGRAGSLYNPKGVAFALGTAVMISAYTLADGLGARHSGSAHAYTALLFVLDGVVLLAYGLSRQRRGIVSALASAWPVALAGGAMSLASYWIAIWAMTVAPIALVSALRETSVLFGALFAVLLLREPLLAARIAAGLVVVAGLVLMRIRL